MNGSAVLAAALQKRINRKRKGPSLESEDSSEAPPQLGPSSQQQPQQQQQQQQQPPGPRQSGSMVSHHDDVVTRMKNVDMIELGRHRIKPWYFAPYPQVKQHIYIYKQGSAYFTTAIQKLL